MIDWFDNNPMLYIIWWNEIIFQGDIKLYNEDGDNGFKNNMYYEI